MSREGIVPIQLLTGFNRVKSLVSGIQMMGETGDIVRNTLGQSKVCEVVKDGVRLKTGWEYWVLPATATTPIEV